MYETILYQVEEGVLTITLNRRAVMNALNFKMTAELLDALTKGEQDAGVRVIVLTGVRRAFCAGADLASMEEDPTTFDNLTAVVNERYAPLITLMQKIQKPIIGAINGAAVGAGLSLALATDLRIAADSAKFILGFNNIGLVPDCGASYFLTRLVGTGKALEMALTNEEIDAEEAARLGLVNRVVPADRLEETVQEFARRLAQGPTLAYGLTKQVMYKAAECDLQTALDTEAECQGVAGRSYDFREGVQAFREKRAPQFEGR
ncbi:MAG: enoyl-CoA hydratase-related protein [Tumebacillaceae bacterium]